MEVITGIPNEATVNPISFHDVVIVYLQDNSMPDSHARAGTLQESVCFDVIKLDAVGQRRLHVLLCTDCPTALCRTLVITHAVEQDLLRAILPTHKCYGL